MRKTLLITAVSGDIGAGAVRVLSGPGLRLVGCDMSPLSPVLDLLDGFHTSPAAQDTDRYLAFLRTIAEKEQARYILPISDSEIGVLSRHRRQVEAWGTGLLVNNATVVEQFSDKLKTASFLAELGIRTPETILLSRYNGEIPFPVIIKPRIGRGSKSLWKAEDKADIEYLKGKNDGSLIVQECVGTEDQEYTTGVFSDGSRVFSITFRRKLGFGGLSREIELADIPELTLMAETIAAATGLDGSINIQSRKDGDLYIPFEINPRLSSTLVFRAHFGFNDALWWIQSREGIPIEYKKAYSAGTAIRCFSECYFDMKK